VKGLLEMNRNAITVSRVSKRYRIGSRDSRHDTLVRQTMAVLKTPLRNLRRLRRLSHFEDGDSPDVIWALRDVSLEIKEGEVVGVIGRNGAGKSTLLKLLTRICEPTSGRIEIRGRVSSLLEVGTGFHQELTGRENTYLNGALLGMSKRELDRKFEQIVDFAGVERFIDTPIKRYSSGMKVRLAFSVAAHLEPEVLLVDEVLAVGDARFQRKCLNKMEGVGKEGRTVVFVSHNMPAITRLCPRAVLLDAGRVTADGPAAAVAGQYLADGGATGACREWDPAAAPGAEVARLRAVRVLDSEGQLAVAVDIRDPVVVEMEYEVLQPGYRLMPNFHFYTEDGMIAFQTHDIDPAWMGRPRPSGRHNTSVVVPGNLLNEGTMFVSAGMQTMEPTIPQFFEPDAVAFQVVDGFEGQGAARGDHGGKIYGAVRPKLEWSSRWEPLEPGGESTNGGRAAGQDRMVRASARRRNA
jgi:lipopolysaccharide transport system ATP-binding protein